MFNVKKKLEEKGITYEEINDADLMIQIGFKTVPMLAVDNAVMDYNAANSWISKL